MTNKSPQTILATARVNARPFRDGRSHPLLEEDETLIQLWYEGLSQAPRKWAIILKTAYEYANDHYPSAGLNPTLWWVSFIVVVREQTEGNHLHYLASRYLQSEGSLIHGSSEVPFEANR